MREAGVPDQGFSIKLHAGNSIAETIDGVGSDGLDDLTELLQHRARLGRLRGEVCSDLVVDL